MGTPMAPRTLRQAQDRHGAARYPLLFRLNEFIGTLYQDVGCLSLVIRLQNGTSR